MSKRVYRDYDADALYAQYNNRAQISEDALAAIKDDQNTRSHQYRSAAARKYLDVAYGAHSRERLDVFLPETDDAPLFAFIHGGYWQWNDKEGFEFLAKEFNLAGAAFANIEYALCPDVTLAELTNQCRRALSHLWQEAARYGYDRDRIVVSGHSAGGHLTAMMLVTDWPTFDSRMPVSPVSAALPISGIYDLEPVRLVPLNEAVRLKEDDVLGLSPMFIPATHKCRVVIAYGGAEYDEFHRQSKDLASEWNKQGLSASALELTGRDHFTALSALAEPEHPLFGEAMDLLAAR